MRAAQRTGRVDAPSTPTGVPAMDVRITQPEFLKNPYAQCPAYSRRINDAQGAHIQAAPAPLIAFMNT